VPSAEPIETPRLRLEPLSVAAAEEMVAVLADAGLYRFTGGAPPTADDLRRRYTAQVAGRSADGAQAWLNWIVRDRATGTAHGYVQATVEDGNADLAWVIGTGSQGRGTATEAAATVLGWLRERGVSEVTAHIHPDHRASARVAEKLGLGPTDVVVDGEVRWSLSSGRP
jgi:RimJ/RimL family protein N-acetyltransferase